MSRKSTVYVFVFVAFPALVLLGCNTSPQAKEAKFLTRGKTLLAQGDFSRALLEFRNASKATPSDAEPFYQSGLAYVGSADLVRAASAFRKATELDPKHVDAQIKLSKILAGTRNKALVEDASKRLEAVLTNAPENSDASDTLAMAEWKLGQTEDAAARLKETLEKAPAHLQSSVELARMKLSRNDLAGAQEVLQNAVVNAPQSPQAALTLGLFYSVAKQPEKAEVEIRRALRLDPKSAPALAALAMLQISSHRMEEAEETYRQLSALPEKEYKHLHALFLFRTGKRDAALAELLNLAHADPKDRPARSRLLAAYVTMGKMTEAQRLLDDSLKGNPKDTDALFQRAELYLKSGNATGAKADLSQVLQFKPDSAEAHYALAEVYLAEGSGQARQELMEALKLNARMLPARLALARSFTVANEPKSALQVLDETPANQKTILGVITERNWALLAAGDVKEMRKNLDQDLKAGRYSELLIQDGVLKLREGDDAGARAAAQEVLKRSPEEIRAAKIIADSYLAQKEPRKALEQLTELAQGHPKSAQLQNVLGQYQLADGKLPEARKSFEAAKSADPNFLQADVALAEIDSKENHPDAARQHLTTVLAAEPRNISALLMLADIERTSGNRTAAITRYRAVVDIDSTNLFALNNLAYILNSDNPDDALRYAQQAGEIAPDSATVQDTLGWIYYRKGIYSTAIGYLKTAVNKEPTPRHQFHLGMSYIKGGDRNLGQKLLAAALQKDPSLQKTEQAW